MPPFGTGPRFAIKTSGRHANTANSAQTAPASPPAAAEAEIATEIELKLSARARDIPILVRALRARAAGGRVKRARLVSTYFDTPDHALRRQQLVLRVRQSNGHFIQTVKSYAEPDAARLARGEWEDAIAGTQPDPQAPETGRFFEAGIAGKLIPLFRTEIGRRTIILAPTLGTRIEAAIDRGRVYVPAGGASEPVREVELELKRGSTAALYDAALDLLAVAPVRLEQRGKDERGYWLATGETPPIGPIHAAPVDLDPQLSADDALRRIGIACLGLILQNEAAALAGVPEGIHQMRVAVRRLRAILSAFGKMLPADQRRAASAGLRWLANALGPARNLDVFKAMLLAPTRHAAADAEAVAALVAAAERRREAAYARAAKAIRSTHYTALLLRLFAWFECCGWRKSPVSHELGEPIAILAPRVLDRRRRVALRRAAGFTRQTEPERHRLRIALKKLRYASELLAGLYDADEVARFLKPLKQLQDYLGEANDLRVGRDIVARLTGPQGRAKAIGETGKAVLDWQQRRLKKREPKLHEHLDRLLTGEPFWTR